MKVLEELLVFWLTCTVSVEHTSFEPHLLKDSWGTQCSSFTCDLVVFTDKAHWGTQCSLFLFLLSSCSAQVALLACLCVVTVPRGTLGYSRQHEQQPSWNCWTACHWACVESWERTSFCCKLSQWYWSEQIFRHCDHLWRSLWSQWYRSWPLPLTPQSLCPSEIHWHMP